MRNAIGLCAVLAALLASSPAHAQCQRNQGSGPGQMSAAGIRSRMAPGFGGGFQGFPGAGTLGYPGYNAAGLYNPLAAGLYGYSRPVWSNPYMGAGLGYRTNGYQTAAQSTTTAQGGGLRTSTQRSTRQSSDQEALSRSLQDLSANRPLHSGTVVRVSDQEVEVKYQDGSEMRTAKFPPKEVFYFRSNGDLANAASNPGELKPGDRVLIPEPEKQAGQQTASSRG